MHDEKIEFGFNSRIVGAHLFSETANNHFCDNILYPFIAQLTEDEIVKALLFSVTALALICI